MSCRGSETSGGKVVWTFVSSTTDEGDRHRKMVTGNARVVDLEYNAKKRAQYNSFFFAVQGCRHGGKFWRLV
jgi:hypothetical protein